MQTFLPYKDFEETARCLDYRRLGKQRVEAFQIWNIVSGGRTTGGWVHHPAVLMWQGFPNALAHYYNTIVSEWISRGYENNMQKLNEGRLMRPHPLPFWFNEDRLFKSHRVKLMRRLPDHYEKFGWSDTGEETYYPKMD